MELNFENVSKRLEQEYKNMEELEQEKTPQQEAFEEIIAREEGEQQELFSINDIRWMESEAK